MKTIEELEKYAKENYIPIARKDLVNFLIRLVKEKGYQKVLEVGSAIGYTSIQLAELDHVHVDTYEYYLPRYEICKQNIIDFNLADKIMLSQEDVMNVDLPSDYDLIFIDGAKRHTIDHFEFLKDKLKDNGTIVVDNIDLKVIDKIEKETKRLKYQKAAEETLNYFQNLKGYLATYMPLGDGIYVICKNNK